MSHVSVNVFRCKLCNRLHKSCVIAEHFPNHAFSFSNIFSVFRTPNLRMLFKLSFRRLENSLCFQFSVPVTLSFTTAAMSHHSNYAFEATLTCCAFFVNTPASCWIILHRRQWNEHWYRYRKKKQRCSCLIWRRTWSVGRQKQLSCMASI